jgi:hypothetical protein
MLVILEHALAYFPTSDRIKSWLIKVYSKLGMVSIVRQLIGNFPYLDELNQQRLGACKYSLFTDFGYDQPLMDLVHQYQDFFKDKVNENKN